MQFKVAAQSQSKNMPQKLFSLRRYLIAMLAAVALWAPFAHAQDYSVTVSYEANNYYRASGALTGIIKTALCSNLTLFSQATLRLITATTGTLTFGDGTQCAVANVFVPATVSPGTYSATVNITGNYFEFIDGSYLVRASTAWNGFGQSVSIRIDSAINGIAVGSITIGNLFPFSLTNIWKRREGATSVVDLVMTGLDLRTAPFDLGGEVVSNPTPGMRLYPHIYFTLAGGDIPEITLLELKMFDEVLCRLTSALQVGSYWVRCPAIITPDLDFMLSATLDPRGVVSEASKANNTLTRVFEVEIDVLFEDRFEKINP